MKKSLMIGMFDSLAFLTFGIFFDTSFQEVVDLDYTVSFYLVSFTREHAETK